MPYTRPLLFSLFLFCFGVICEDEEIGRLGHLPQMHFSTRQKRQIVEVYPDLSNSVFTPIDNKQDGATQVESAPLWIAQVKHKAPNSTKTLDLVMCTAVCVKEQIFITASRCLVTLRVPYTVVVYQEEELKAKAFVEPDENRKQMFEDISLIVTGSMASEKSWKTIEVFKTKPTNKYLFRGYSWFKRYLNKVDDEFSVIGFVSNFSTETPEKIEHQLYELPVKVSMDICANLLNEYYQVPCFFNCTVLEHSRNKLNCQKYLRGLGHALVQKPEGKDDILVGITTWAVVDKSEAMPVGFAIADAYRKNILCAEKIADDHKKDVEPDYYKSLCEEDIFEIPNNV